MSRTVICSRLKREAPGLEAPPFPGKIGQEIFEKVSAEAFDEWKEMQTKIINEHRLDLSERKDRETLMKQMRLFLHLDGDAGGQSAKLLRVGTPT